ncbi:MAG TPA: divergent PAP2 family protein [Patescibacteria group bacterium]|nr:divergent PAP2 family protein [Patescibacteria group bacterium]
MWYIVMPLLAWLVAGSVKFVVNYCRFGRQAIGLVGNGGFPSTHTTVAAGTVGLIVLREGLQSPVVGLGIAFLLITVIDAMGLRRAVGRQASRINQLEKQAGRTDRPLRERQGHTPLEVLGGAVLGMLLALLVQGLAGGTGVTP